LALERLATGDSTMTVIVRSLLVTFAASDIAGILSVEFLLFYNLLLF